MFRLDDGGGDLSLGLWVAGAARIYESPRGSWNARRRRLAGRSGRAAGAAAKARSRVIGSGATRTGRVLYCAPVSDESYRAAAASAARNVYDGSAADRASRLRA